MVNETNEAFKKQWEELELDDVEEFKQVKLGCYMWFLFGYLYARGKKK